MNAKKPALKFSNKLPSVSQLNPKRSILIYDEVLGKSFQSWIEKFPFRYAVPSGEVLKDLHYFPSHFDRIMSISQAINERPLQVICLGGGSVGDFAGFVASVFKRGVDFIQIPSTWLAAIDSAHGGKNALNVGSVKNQVGTFHSPLKVYLAAELLLTQPRERVHDALGEALKISLISGGSLWKKFQATRIWNFQSLWQLLPDLIEAKYKVVQKDPFETKGIRHLLNLGHTVGHVIEAELRLSHGQSVMVGLGFALRWSQQLKILKSKEILEVPLLAESDQWIKELTQPEKFLSQDKKRVSGGKIRFIFLEKPGKPVIRAVTVPQILKEIQRQSQ